MAPKRPPPSEDPPQAFSSEEEDSLEEEEEEEEPLIESEEPYSAIPLQLKIPQQESSDSGSESESGSDSEPNHTDNIRPIASKPMDKPKPSQSKPSAVVPASKKLFQRLFSEDDEIALFKGMIEFTAKKGKDPVLYIDEFHEFIKKSIHIDVTRSQLIDKIRRLKKKFENNVSKAKKGKDRSFSNAHEQRTYDLSKNIWGCKDRTSNGRVTQDTKSVEENVRELNGTVESRGGKVVKFGKIVSGVGLESYVLNKGLDLIEGEKKVELEMKWKTLQVAELELFARRAELIAEQSKLVLEAEKSMDA